MLAALALVAGAAEKAPPESCGFLDEKEPCFEASSQPAGPDARGRPMTVVEVVYAKPGTEWRHASYGEPCTRYQYWVLHEGEDDDTNVQLLLELCNDGYGASGIGDDEVTVAPNRLTHSQMGGSAWRWSNSTTLQLSPLRVLAESSSGYWSLGPNSETSSWDWQTFSGSSSWYAPRCDEDGAAIVDESRPLNEPETTYSLIPSVTLAAPRAAADWAGVALGGCAAVVDSTGAGGFVTHGEPGAASDASFRVVAIGKSTLVVEVADDTWTTGGKSWLHDDHLEIWLADRDAGYSWGSHCLDPSLAARQWGIRIADGETFAAHGKPTGPPTVTRHETADGAVRLVLAFPDELKGLTVVYSDSDDGKSQERLIATSPVMFGDPYSLGGLRTIRPEEAVCAVEAGKLVVQETRKFQAGKPAISP